MFTRWFLNVGLVAAVAACARAGVTERAAPVQQPMCPLASAPSTGASAGARTRTSAAGLRVFVAPESGEFVEPAPGTIVEPADAAASRASSASGEPVELESPEGGRMVRLDGRQLHYVVAHATDAAPSVRCDQHAP